MEHLTCMTPDDLKLFLEVTEMKILAATSETIVAAGREIFTYTWDFAKDMYCLVQGEVT